MGRYWLTAAVISAGLVNGAAVAQSRIWTQPALPNRELLDRLNLNQSWSVKVPMDGRHDGIATIQSIGGQVIVQSFHGRILCLDGATGAVRWMTEVGQPYQVPYEVAFNDDTILVSNATRIYGLDRADGSLKWDIDLPTVPMSPPAADIFSFSINLSNGRLATYLLPDAEKYIKLVQVGKTAPPAIAAAAKTKAQQSIDPRTLARASAPAGGSGRTVTVSSAVDNRSATVQVTVGGRTAIGNVDIKKAFAETSSTNAPTQIWDYHTTRRVYDRPVIGTHTILDVGADGTVMVLNRGGEPISDLKTTSPVIAPVGQYGDFAYIADQDGVIYAYDLERRVLLWRYRANGSVSRMPQVTDDDLFIATDRNGLIRLDRQAGYKIWQNMEASRYLSANPKFVYATDRTGNLLVLDRRRGTLLAKLDVSKFVFPAQNETTDRILLAAHDGTVISLNDKAYVAPFASQNEGAKISVPAAAPAKDESKPAKTLPSKPADKEKTPPKTDAATPASAPATKPDPMKDK
jgi:outer membrane protein assembly factor BamB